MAFIAVLQQILWQKFYWNVSGVVLYQPYEFCPKMATERLNFSRKKKKFKNLLLRGYIAFIAVHSGERCGRWASSLYCHTKYGFDELIKSHGPFARYFCCNVEHMNALQFQYFNHLSSRMPKLYWSNCGICRSNTKICVIKFDFKYAPYPIYLLANKCLYHICTTHAIGILGQAGRGTGLSKLKKSVSN